jgi:hypothetical protein
VRVFRKKLTLEDAIGSHACSLEASMRVTNGIPLGCSLLLPVDTVICVQTLKAVYLYRGVGGHQGLTKPPEVMCGHAAVGHRSGGGAGGGAGGGCGVGIKFITKASLSPDSRFVVSGSTNRAAFVWEVNPTRQSRAPAVPWVLDNFDGHVYGARFWPVCDAV